MHIEINSNLITYINITPWVDDEWALTLLVDVLNRYTQELLSGVNEYDEFASRQLEFQHGGKYQGKCTKCKITVSLMTD